MLKVTRPRLELRELMRFIDTAPSSPEEARADEWLLYATDSPWSGGGRGFNRGRIFNQSGDLVASVAQEGMIRRRKSKG